MKYMSIKDCLFSNEISVANIVLHLQDISLGGLSQLKFAARGLMTPPYGSLSSTVLVV